MYSVFNTCYLKNVGIHWRNKRPSMLCHLLFPPSVSLSRCCILTARNEFGSYIENYPRDVLAPVFFHSTIPQKKLMIPIHKRFPTKGTNFTKTSTLRFGDILQGGPLAVISGGITPINIRL